MPRRCERATRRPDRKAATHRRAPMRWYDLAVARPPETAVRRRGVSRALPAGADEQWAARRAVLLKALADPTRLSMVAALQRATGPVCICDFTAAYELSQPTISHHMARLRSAGLVEASRRGIWIYYRLRPDLPGAVRRLLAAAVSAA